jgi:hypothetical protein
VLRVGTGQNVVCKADNVRGSSVGLRRGGTDAADPGSQNYCGKLFDHEVDYFFAECSRIKIFATLSSKVFARKNTFHQSINVLREFSPKPFSN